MRRGFDHTLLMGGVHVFCISACGRSYIETDATGAVKSLIGGATKFEAHLVRGELEQTGRAG